MTRERFDYVIVGGGPAGLQMSYFLQKAGRSHVVLEAADSPGRFFRHFPRHRTLISLNKRYNFHPEDEFNLRHDWNSLLSDDPALRFTRYSEALFPAADDLVKYLQDYATKLKLNVRCGTRVEAIRRNDDGFEVRAADGATFAARCILMATGAIRGRVPDDVEGIELAAGYEDHSLDLRQYENKRVAILGRGNSAMETAKHLIGHAAIIHLVVGDRAPRLAWDTHYVGDVRAINNDLFDMWQLKSLHAVIGVRPTKISRNENGSLTMAFEERVGHWDPPGTGTNEFDYDHIIRCTGWRYVNSELFDAECAPAPDALGKYPVLSPSWESSTPNVYYIGTAMASRDRRAASGFIHGFRYNIRTLSRLLERRYHAVSYPSRVHPLRTAVDLEAMADALFERVSTSSALYQMNGVLCDAIVVKDGEATVYQELPVDYVLADALFRDEDELCLITLEYGFHHYDKNLSALRFIHTGDMMHTRTNPFLRPVFRRFKGGELLEELYFHEDLQVRFDKSPIMLPRVLNLLGRMAHAAEAQRTEQLSLAGFTPLSEDELTEDDLLLRPPSAGPRA